MSNSTRILIVAIVVLVAGGVLVLKNRNATSSPGQQISAGPAGESTDGAQSRPATQPAALPKLVDLGAKKCIPCKMMAPVLEELKKEYAGRMDVVFIDVWENNSAIGQYRISTIPTQVFYDASGKELYRHEGFYSKEDILAKWKELGVNLAGKPSASIARETPVVADNRPRDAVCFMCDGDIDPGNRVIVKGESEQVALCCPHCFFIYYSSLPQPGKVETITSVTDAASGNLVPATTATYLYSLDQHGRPKIAAYADSEAASKAQQKGGNLLSWEALRAKEMTTRCGFCDRAMYPEDGCQVKVAGTTHTYGCCVMCGLGVAARLQKDIEVTAKDALTGESILVRTLDGSVGSLDPRTAVAWAGGKKGSDGSWASTGCFKQAFFVNETNLRSWLDKHPTATGRMVTIGQALAAKMKMTPQQIAKACKIGECK